MPRNPKTSYDVIVECQKALEEQRVYGPRLDVRREQRLPEKGEWVYCSGENEGSGQCHLVVETERRKQPAGQYGRYVSCECGERRRVVSRVPHGGRMCRVCLKRWEGARG